MRRVGFHSLGAVALAIVCAAVMGVTSMLTSAFVFGVEKVIAQIKLLSEDDYIMGGTSAPDPGAIPGYIAGVEQLYLNEGNPIAVNTPEEFCPPVCFAAPADDPSSWTNLNFGDSLTVGTQVLNGDIGSLAASGGTAAVLGYSQSATLATEEMENLQAAAISDPNLSFVLLGDPSSPIGGILDRFQFPDGVRAFSLQSAPQHLPFLNVPLSMAPTPTTPFPTDIYTGEYDGFANWPENPTNVLADINAGIGIETVHPYYPDPTPGVNLDINNVIDLGTIGNTHFYEIPAPLPMLAFMYDGGPAGQFFYDAFNPFLSLINNWAYGNPGDPGAGIPVDGIDPIGAAGPWQVDATGQLVASGVAGLLPKMDPLQMLAGGQYAAVQTLVGPINALLQDAGRSPLPESVTGTLLSLSGYDFTNQLDASLLTGWTDLATALNVSDLLGPDAIFSGAPLISGQPLIDLVGVVFDIFNFFGA
jgi:hypothetical protein